MILLKYFFIFQLMYVCLYTFEQKWLTAQFLDALSALLEVKIQTRFQSLRDVFEIYFAHYECLRDILWMSWLRFGCT